MALVNGLEMVPENSVLCIEERNGNIKSIYALYVASERARAGTPVTFLTLQTKEDVLRRMEQLRIPGSDLLTIVEIRPVQAKNEVLTFVNGPGDPLIIIESFAIFFAGDSFSDLSSLLFGLISNSRTGRTFLLLVDSGILPEREENLVRAIADGIIEFTIVPEGDKLKHYINIPKMRGAYPRDKMLPYTVNEEGLLIDTRERHG